MIHTNRCICGKTKKEHYGMAQLCEEMNYDGPQFYDSGLAALDAHKEELYEIVKSFEGFANEVLLNQNQSGEVIYAYNKQEITRKMLRMLLATLNQIEKEK